MPRMMYSEETDSIVPIYTCHLCCDRKRITVPGKGIAWDKENGYFDTYSCFSVHCPLCAADCFWSGMYTRETYAFLADWGAIQGGEKRMLTREQRQAITNLVIQMAERGVQPNRDRWYVHA